MCIGVYEININEFCLDLGPVPQYVYASILRVQSYVGCSADTMLLHQCYVNSAGPPACLFWNKLGLHPEIRKNL